MRRHVIGAAGADAAAAAQAAEDEMSREMTRLFSPFFPDGEPPQPVPSAPVCGPAYVFPRVCSCLCDPASVLLCM